MAKKDKQGKPGIRAARLDADGVYQGMDDLPDAAALTAQHLPDIDDCDLPPGQYRWDAARGTFLPLPKKHAPGLHKPDASNTLALLIHAMQHGLPLPDECVAWKDQHANSLDFRPLSAKIKGEKA